MGVLRSLDDFTSIENDIHHLTPYAGDLEYFSYPFEMRVTFPGRKYFEGLDAQSSEATSGGGERSFLAMSPPAEARLKVGIEEWHQSIPVWQSKGRAGWRSCRIVLFHSSSSSSPSLEVFAA